MKRFLQGLGLGLVVAAIVMGIGTRGSGSEANESVIEKARELGMVFPSSSNEPQVIYADPTEGPVSDDQSSSDTASGGAIGGGVGGDADGSKSEATDAPSEAPTATPDKSKNPKKTPKPAATIKPTPKKSAKPKKTKDPNASSDPNATPKARKNLAKGTTVIFKVRSGLLSSSVARELYEAGVIDDMWEFDHYIERHGLGHKIISGKYELTVGDSYAKIAKIITHG